MADYFAVLSRTLAGFGEPKPELRGKLYERARMTIRRQLDSHVPPLDEAALKAEMNKLEEAIKKVESGFAPPNIPLEKKQSGAEAPGSPPQDKSAEAELPKAEETETPKAEEKKTDGKQLDEKPVEPTALEKPEPDLQPEAKAPVSRKERRAAAKEEAKLKKSEPKPKKVAAEETKKEVVESDGKPAAKEAAAEVDRVEEVKPEKTEKAKVSDKTAKASKEADDVSAPEPGKQPAPETAASEAKSGTDGEAVDPMDDWAREFLNAQEESKPEVAQALAEIQAETEKSSPQAGIARPDPDERAATIAAAATAAASKSATKEPVPELPAFEASQDKTITIPQAPSSDADPKKGGILKWLGLALLALLIAIIGYLAVNWEDRAEIAARFGMGNVFGGTVEPRPVKTIKIVPDPEPEPQPAPVTETPAVPEPDSPKSEDRLTTGGDVEQPATPAPAAPTVADEQTAPAADPDDGASAQSDETLPAAEAGTAPVVAQSAILYEEGGSPTDNSFDTGRVVWSAIEEQGGEGEGNIPAIRGRVEVPSRQLVLIMTIKRNSDRALPASHLIELVFAVPDDFSGGSIGEINRFVLKESEQDRGAALIGVPARISDGIFLIALNNLESAQRTNEQLLRSRPWIDIPMQYRTGRRALITLEKGVPGGKVFSDVFEAWDKLDNKP